MMINKELFLFIYRYEFGSICSSLAHTTTMEADMWHEERSTGYRWQSSFARTLPPSMRNSEFVDDIARRERITTIKTVAVIVGALCALVAASVFAFD